MGKSSRLKDVYAELRRELDPTVSGKDVLVLASALILAFEKEESSPKFSSHEATAASFSQWPLDRAFADGGWRVLSHEEDLSAFADQEDIREQYIHYLKVNYRNNI